MSCFVRWLVTHSSSSCGTVGNSKELHTERPDRLDRSSDQSGAASRGGEQQYDQQTDRMALADVHRQQQPAAETPQATKSGQESPFLNALVGTRVLAAAAVELYRDNTQLRQENEIFAEKAAKFDRQRQQKQDSYYRQKEADREGWRERERVRRADYRARKKQETQEGQKPEDTRS